MAKSKRERKEKRGEYGEKKRIEERELKREEEENRQIKFKSTKCSKHPIQTLDL